jgi:hypothetical protein
MFRGWFQLAKWWPWLTYVLPKSRVLLYFFFLFFTAYGGNVLSCKAVHNWAEKFSQGRSNVADDAHPCRPVEIVTEAPLQGVEELVRSGTRITIDSVATGLGWSHGLAYRIMHDSWMFRKMCARRVPKEVKDREKINRLGLSLQPLVRYTDGGEETSMLNMIVAGDELWVHHY